ncbi:Cytidine deaminase [Planctomycetes bacterium MalM25]|nr:Cytidine deaminase [Planctomycetes bacterium MalM25]
MAELTEEVRRSLIEVSLAARTNAYAPFSKFHVGAAVLDDRVQITAGVNVENSSYGLTICAERTAATAAVTAGARKILAVAVATPGAAAPCGACRQFMYELGPEATVLLVDSDSGEVQRTVALNELLPAGFRLTE